MYKCIYKEVFWNHANCLLSVLRSSYVQGDTYSLSSLHKVCKYNYYTLHSKGYSHAFSQRVLFIINAYFLWGTVADPAMHIGSRRGGVHFVK